MYVHASVWYVLGIYAPGDHDAAPMTEVTLSSTLYPCSVTQPHHMHGPQGARCFSCSCRSNPKIPLLQCTLTDMISHTSWPQQVFCPASASNVNSNIVVKFIAGPELQAAQSPHSHPAGTRRAD